jgi:hypothetical protein
MNDEQGTRGSKHGTDNVSRSPTHPKHTTTTPTNRGKGCSERKRKAEESVEELKQLQAKEAEAQTAENAAEEAAKRTTTAEDASNGTGAREGDGDPSPWPDASEAEWVKFFKVLKDAETTAKAIATNRAAALEADQAEKDHCRHVKGLPCDNRRCNLVICLRQQQLRDYVMRHPTKPKSEAEEKEETLCYNCSKPGHQSYECPDNNDWQTAATDQEWPHDKNWTADTGEQKNNDPVCYHCHRPWQGPEKCYSVMDTPAIPQPRYGIQARNPPTHQPTGNEQYIRGTDAGKPGVHVVGRRETSQQSGPRPAPDVGIGPGVDDDAGRTQQGRAVRIRKQPLLALQRAGSQEVRMP